MALVIEFKCRHCGAPKTEVVTPSRICASCRIGIAESEEREHLAKLRIIPLDERIRKIELALYRLDAESRLKALEAHHTRY